MGPFGDKKIQKSCTVPKNSKGDPIVPSGFVSFVKNEKMKEGPFALTLMCFRWPAQ